MKLFNEKKSDYGTGFKCWPAHVGSTWNKGSTKSRKNNGKLMLSASLALEIERTDSGWGQVCCDELLSAADESCRPPQRLLFVHRRHLAL